MNIVQIAMCYRSMDLSQRALQIDEKIFSNSILVFEILAENRKFWPKNKKIFKRLAMREYSSNCNVLYSNEFVSTSSTN